LAICFSFAISSTRGRSRSGSAPAPKGRTDRKRESGASLIHSEQLTATAIEAEAIKQKDPWRTFANAAHAGIDECDNV